MVESQGFHVVIGNVHLAGMPSEDPDHPACLGPGPGSGSACRGHAAMVITHELSGLNRELSMFPERAFDFAKAGTVIIEQVCR